MDQRQGTYESYGEWTKRIRCENASTQGRGSITPQCVSGKKEYRCTVTYDKYGISSDTLDLCAKCRETLMKAAANRRYKFRSKKLRADK